MKYYQRNLGDYARDSGWLTTYQHGVYSLLLDWYYANERAPSVDLCYRIVKARSGPERKATNEVLLAFFDLNKEPGFAHNKHADIAIDKYRIKAAANSLIAQEREDTKRARNVPDSCNEKSKNVEPIQYPVSKIQEEAKSNNPSGCLLPAGNTPDCPHAEIVALYHELLPANPRIKEWEGARQANLRARWRQDPKRQTLDYWRRFFSHVAASEFLTGRTTDRDGRPFLPGLDWLVMPKNFAKVIENRYHDRSAA